MTKFRLLKRLTVAKAAYATTTRSPHGSTGPIWDRVWGLLTPSKTQTQTRLMGLVYLPIRPGVVDWVSMGRQSYGSPMECLGNG